MSSKKIDVVFVLPSLIAGGAERIMSFVAGNLDHSKFNIKLIIIGFEQDNVYDLKDIDVIYFNKYRVLYAITDLFWFFKKNKPDIVVSSIVHLNTIIAFLSPFFRKTKFVSREANVLSVLSKYNPYTKSIFPKGMVVLAYKLVDKIICQSKDMQKDMIANYNVPLAKTVLINNPITNSFKIKSHVRNNTKPIKFITIGRLSREKGFDRIIESLSKVKFQFEYTIIGDGIEKENLFQQIENLGLTNNINYIKFTSNVEQYLSESDLFLQGSYVEGFPNVLIESCVVGTPVLAFNAPGGLDEIIEHGINGYVEDDAEKFIKRLKAINEEYPFHSEKVNEVVVRKFNSNRIMNLYTDLFINLTS
jgi:glycosyltransferase involved in cell wall biosynthesis